MESTGTVQAKQPVLRDVLGRPVRDLRVSVTDRCNFRCTYCMPNENYEWLAHREVLSYEEIARLARLFLTLGVNKIRLTGGEPLLRRDLPELVARLSSLPGLEDLCLTTNGALLASQAPALATAGLKRINISLDTVNPVVYKQMTGRDHLARVIRGLEEAQRAGFDRMKINAVVIRGVNDVGILDLVEFAREHGCAIRFIEYMDAGNANDWKSEKLMTKDEILAVVRTRFALEEFGREHPSSPAVGYRFVDGRGDIGVIASVTEPFCGGCTRARLTADGRLVTCLFSDRGHDLKGMLRRGTADEDLVAFISSVWSERSDRYSELRLASLNSGEGYIAGSHTKIEMIKLGG